MIHFLLNIFPFQGNVLIFADMLLPEVIQNSFEPTLVFQMRTVSFREDSYKTVIVKGVISYNML